MRGRRRRNGRERVCVARGCGRKVATGKVVCGEHLGTAEGRAAQAAVARLAGDISGAVARVGDGKRDEGEVRGAFRQRIERGEYGTLLEVPLRAVVRQAAAERSLDEEIGALRIAAKRMLMEEEDPARMALGLSRVTSVLGRLVNVEQGLIERRDRWAWEEMTREERREEERREAKTIGQVVKEWRAQGGEARGSRMEGRVVQAEDEDGIIDAFSEMRSGYWDQFPEVDG